MLHLHYDANSLKKSFDVQQKKSEEVFVERAQKILGRLQDLVKKS